MAACLFMEMEYVSLHLKFCYDLALLDISLGPHDAVKCFKLKAHFSKCLFHSPIFNSITVENDQV